MSRIGSLALVAALLIGAPTRADEPLLPPPGAAIRLSSFHDFLEDVKYVVSLSQGVDAAKRIEGLITSVLGENLGGLDTKRPLAGFVWFGANPNDIRPLLLAPVADQ